MPIVSGGSGGSGSAFAPTWTNFAATVTGFTGSPTVKAAYIQAGKLVIFRFQVQGTSNATTFTIGLPVAAGAWGTNGDCYTFGQGRDNTVNLTTPAMIEIVASATSATIYKDGSFAAWTNTGTKQAYGEIMYESA